MSDDRDEIINDLYAAQASLKASMRRVAHLEKALICLRDCDWVISLPDRMDAVRKIAKDALEGKGAE